MSREPREYYSEKLQGDLGEIAERLDELEYSMESEGWEPESDYEELLSGVRVELRQAAELVEGLVAAGDEQWPDLLEEATEAVAAVGRSYDRVAKLVGRMLPEEQ